MRSLFRSGVIVLGFLLTWECLVRYWRLPYYILPTPIAVFRALGEQYRLILTHLIPTLAETLAGFSLGVIFGAIAALCLSAWRPLARWFLPTLIISQAIPTFAIAPLFVVWLGYGLASKIAVTILMIFFPIASTFYDGLRATPQPWLDLAKTMNGTTANIYTYIRIPNALPAFASGLRLSAVASPIGAIVGEWVGSSRGLGYLMLYANERMQIDMMFAVLIVIIMLSLLLYFTVDKLLRTFIRHGALQQ